VADLKWSTVVGIQLHWKKNYTKIK
jgi:hypothetical protein